MVGEIKKVKQIFLPIDGHSEEQIQILEIDQAFVFYFEDVE